MARKDRRGLKGLVVRMKDGKPVTDIKGRPLYDVRLYPAPGEAPDYFSVGLVEAEARRFYNARKEEIKQGKYFPHDFQVRNQITLSKILDEYMDTTISKKARRREFDYCRWWQNYFKDSKAYSLTPASIETARAKLSEGRFAPFRNGKGQHFRPCGPTTVNKYTDWLGRVCKWAIKQGRLRENPVLAITKHKVASGKQIFWFTAAQENNLCEHLTDEQIDCVRLGILTGLRRAEQFRINKLTDLELSLGAILPADDKQGRADALPLSDEALEIVIRQSARHPNSPWLFPGLRGRGPMNARLFYEKFFLPACVKAGIPMVPGRKLWHALRHTFGTRLAMTGASNAELKKAGRWTTEAAERYVHLADPFIRKRLNQLSDFQGFQKTASKTAREVIDLENIDR